MLKSFTASLDKLYEMLNFVREFAEKTGFEHGHITKIELALEEALVNIISYGYPDEVGIIEIYCSTPHKIGIQVIIKDNGIPYNPLAKSNKYKKLSSLEDHTIGGYGIYFILKIMDEVDYKREDNCNILRMVKYLESKTPSVS